MARPKKGAAEREEEGAPADVQASAQPPDAPAEGPDTPQGEEGASAPAALEGGPLGPGQREGDAVPAAGSASAPAGDPAPHVEPVVHEPVRYDPALSPKQNVQRSLDAPVLAQGLRPLEPLHAEVTRLAREAFRAGDYRTAGVLEQAASVIAQLRYVAMEGVKVAKGHGRDLLQDLAESI
ncbi:MAG: hypothetical protein ACREUT_20375 [Steroidobacteraceae bacterium]